MWGESAEELIINLMFTVFYLFIIYYLIHFIDFTFLIFSILNERIILFP